MVRPATLVRLTDAQSKLVGEHYRLICRFARMYRLPDWPLDDFRSEMVLAVMRAATKYESRQGAFATWAWKFMFGRASTLKWNAAQKKNRNHPDTIYLDPLKLDRIPA